MNRLRLSLQCIHVHVNELRNILDLDTYLLMAIFSANLSMLLLKESIVF